MEQANNLPIAANTSLSQVAANTSTNSTDNIMITTDDDKQKVLLSMLYSLDNAVQKGKLDDVKKIIKYIRVNSLFETKILSTLYIVDEKCITQIDLIISACMSNRSDILKYLIRETDILHLLKNPTVAEDKLDMQKFAAFRYAMISYDFSIVEMLYDFWCNTIHCTDFGTHDENNITNNIKTIGRTLTNAFNNCKSYLAKKSNLLVNIHCLIKFNTFQNELYTELQKLKMTDTSQDDFERKVKAMKSLISTVIPLYRNYSCIDKVRLPHVTVEKENYIKECLLDKSSIYVRGQLYLWYEVYFRKLDFNVSSLILGNLDFLKKHLGSSDSKDKTDLYQDIECQIYYFIYRTNEDWRLYLPKIRTKLTHNALGLIDDTFINLEIECDELRIIYGVILFFERLNFERSLEKLVDEMTNLQAVKKKVTPACMNYLTQLPYMRDDYSLKKMINFIETISKVTTINDEKGVLIVERAIQIIGEMLKSTPESLHLSKSIKSLLQAEFSIKTIKELKELREFLSHIDENQLTRRLDAATNKISKYQDVYKDLKKMLCGLKLVETIYTPIVDRSFIKKGLDLLEDRIKQLPESADVKRIQFEYLKKIPNLENHLMLSYWHKTGLTEQLLKEIIWILQVKEKLTSKKESFDQYINAEVLNSLSKYLEIAKFTLTDIRDNNDKWNKIKCELPNYIMPEFPDQNSIKRIKNKVQSKKNLKSCDLESLLESIKDLTEECEFIKNILQFCTKEINVLQDYATDIPENFKPYSDTLKKVDELIDKMKLKLKNPLSNHTRQTFNGINDLVNVFSGNKKKTDNVKAKRYKILTCLISRITTLQNTLQYEIKLPISQQVMNHKHDLRFRIIVEMLLGDIFNILPKCGCGELTKKRNKLLAEIGIGNVLDHGNPFLEIIGNILDDQDFSTEIMSKAIMIAEDGESIKALYELFKDGITPDSIENDDTNSMNDDQINNLQTFKQCSERWVVYLKLIKVEKKINPNLENNNKITKLN